MKLENRARVITGTTRLTAVGAMAITLALACNPRSRAHAADEPASEPAPQRAVEPAAPVIPGSLVAALQGGDYETARRSLVTLRAEAKSDDDRAYFAYLQAIAERLAGQRESSPRYAQSRIAGQSQRALVGQDPLRAGRHRAGRGQPGGRRRAGSRRGRIAPWPATARIGSPACISRSHRNCSSPATHW